MKKIKYLILLFLAILSVVSVKAYNFTGISKGSRTELGLYLDDTRVLQVSCTSSNDGYCGLEDSDLPNSSNTYNNILFASRDNLNQSFTTGTQYKFSFYFYQYTPGYFLRSSDITNVTGGTWQNFNNWTANELTIISYNLNLLETDSNVALYRLDVIAIPTSSTVAGFYFKVYQGYETISNNNNSYMEMTRYLSLTQLSPGQIDYSQDFNQVNTNINNLGDTITNNQNSNTQDIIDNQNQNAQDIQNTINDNFQSCRDSYNLANFFSNNVSILNHATYTQSYPNLIIVTSNSEYGAVRLLNTYLNLRPNTTYTFSAKIVSTDSSIGSAVYVNSNLNAAGQRYGNYAFNGQTSTITFTTPSTFSENSFIGLYPRTSNGSATFADIMLNEGSTSKPYEKYGEQICTNKIDETNNAINGVNDSINNSDTSSASSNASNFFSGFTTETYGLTGVITAPLNVIQSITSKTCSPLVLPLPFVNQNLTLPCMGQIYSQYFGDFLTIYQTITFGVVAYWVVVRIFNLVKDFKNPDHDEIEVLDL